MLGSLDGDGLGVRSLLLSEANHNIDETTVVCHPLLGTSCLLLLLFLFLNFGGLTLNFTSTSKTSVDLSCTLYVNTCQTIIQYSVIYQAKCKGDNINNKSKRIKFNCIPQYIPISLADLKEGNTHERGTSPANQEISHFWVLLAHRTCSQKDFFTFIRSSLGFYRNATNLIRY